MEWPVQTEFLIINFILWTYLTFAWSKTYTEDKGEEKGKVCFFSRVRKQDGAGTCVLSRHHEGQRLGMEHKPKQGATPVPQSFVYQCNVPRRCVTRHVCLQVFFVILYSVQINDFTDKIYTILMFSTYNYYEFKVLLLLLHWVGNSFFIYSYLLK